VQNRFAILPRYLVFGLWSLVFIVCSCAKNDPILPGTRTEIFPGASLSVENKEIPESALAEITPHASRLTPHAFTQDNQNNIFDGERKIFSGLATTSFVAGTRVPAFSGGFVYAGLSTGEVVKVNPKNKELKWVADVYSRSNMTGGLEVLDIVAPVIVANNCRNAGPGVYAGGLGGEFCRLRDSDGRKLWCVPIAAGVPFSLSGCVAFVAATDNFLYAIDADKGAIYWRAEIKKQKAPVVAGGIVSVGKEKFSVRTGINQKKK
jgi:outer membrane protein assembly factor BamB